MLLSVTIVRAGDRHFWIIVPNKEEEKRNWKCFPHFPIEVEKSQGFCLDSNESLAFSGWPVSSVFQRQN